MSEFNLNDSLMTGLALLVEDQPGGQEAYDGSIILYQEKVLKGGQRLHFSSSKRNEAAGPSRS
ncbi:MAG: hypothetical protein ACE1Z2_04715 [Acidobacteriota bacterium]